MFSVDKLWSVREVPLCQSSAHVHTCMLSGEALYPEWAQWCVNFKCCIVGGGGGGGGGGVSCCSRFRVSVGASEHPFKNHSTILAGFVYVLITNRSCTFFFFFAYEKKLFC